MHRIVGLDWAQDGLRVATAQSSFRGFAIQEVRTAPISAEGSPVDRLKGALAQLGLEPPLGSEDLIAVALPGAMVASHLVTLPFVDSKRIEQVLPAEVESAIPFDIQDVVWDFAVLSQSAGKTEVLVGIVKKSALREHLETLAAAGIEPRVVTFAPLALAALGEKHLLSSKDGAGAEPQALTVALLEAGPERANLVLLDGGRPTHTRAIASMGAAAWEAARTDETALARVLSGLARDVKISLRARGAKGAAPQTLLLAGPVALLPGAAERLGAELQIPAEAAQLHAGTPEHALALGLAVRAQTPRGRINFRKGEFAFKTDLWQVRGQFGRLGIAAGVLLVLALGLGMARLSSLRSQAAAFDEAVCSATRRILGTCLTDYRQAVGQLSGGKSRAAGIPRVSGADVFAELVARMPEGALPTLEDVEVTTTSIRIKGSAESFAKVEDITAALKKDKCFGEIKPPRTERAGSRISFNYDFGYVCSGELPGGA
jgi:general secretion pathway protein L